MELPKSTKNNKLFAYYTTATDSHTIVFHDCSRIYSPQNIHPQEKPLPDSHIDFLANRTTNNAGHNECFQPLERMLINPWFEITTPG